MLTIQILKRARKLLRKGWCQENTVMWDEKGAPEAYCIVGAVAFASRAAWEKEALAARKRIFEALPAGAKGLVDFNDKAGRKKEEVLKVMDEAIRLEEAGLPWWQRVIP